MRLYYAEWLVHATLYDEAREQLAGLQPKDVVAPAALLNSPGTSAAYAGAAAPVFAGRSPVERAILASWDDPLWWRGPGTWGYRHWVGPRWRYGAWERSYYEREVALLIRERALGRPTMSAVMEHVASIAGASYYLRVDVHIDRAAYPAVKERLVKLGYSPSLLGGTRPADFRKVVNEELERVTAVIRDAKIQAQ